MRHILIKNEEFYAIEHQCERISEHVENSHMGAMGATYFRTYRAPDGQCYLMEGSMGGESIYLIDESCQMLNGKPLVIDVAHQGDSTPSADGGVVFPAYGTLSSSRRER